MNAQSEPLVSILTPVYNEEKYLAECVDSILAQTYSNWELTIVNNQSVDRSLEIAAGYASGDSRIRVITTPEFFPQDRNFNYALRQMSPHSKYCKVVQGDTWIFPDCLRLMVQAAEAHPTVGIVSSLWMTSEQVHSNTLPYPSLFIPGREICRIQLLSDEDYFGSPTTVMYRSDVVRKRDPFYREEARSSDAEACFEILQEWDFSFIHQLLSFNRTDNISVSTPSRHFARFILNQYVHLRRYGPVFLTPAENAEAQRLFTCHFYSFLAERALTLPGKAFWDYHRQALATIGEQLSWPLLGKYVVREILAALLSPKQGVSWLIRQVSRQREPMRAGRIVGVRPTNRRS
jgi:glycosyltransferase involved in cell wall biosynthesis